MKKSFFYALGLMSGTSADGVSIAYCKIDFKKRNIKLIAFKNYLYNREITQKIINARDLKTQEISYLNYELGKIWTKKILMFIKEFGIKKIDVIGSHGQTVYHNSSQKNTFQIGEVSFIAEALRKPVICDFRHQDIAAGGEGAPLVPFLDEFMFGNFNPIALQNIGGIGNISVVGKGIKTYGFDTGPGNSLMDWAILLLTNGKQSYDKDGQWAKRGIIDKNKVIKFMKNDFFYKKPPKSLDREEFGKKFVEENFKLCWDQRFNILATLNYFTAYSIAFSVKNYIKEKIEKIIISGGGAFNPVLISNIKSLLGNIEVLSIENYGINPLAKEAMAFALLAASNIIAIPSNCPNVTGARGFRILGKKIYPFNYVVHI